MQIFFVQIFCVLLAPLLNIFWFCYVHTISVLYWAHLCIKCFLGISDFLEEISSLSHSIVFSISLHWSLKKVFVSLFAVLRNSGFRWVYLSFSPLPLASFLSYLWGFLRQPFCFSFLGDGGTKPNHFSILALRTPWTVWKGKKMTLKEELPRSICAQHATGEEWRNNSRKNEETEPKQKQHPVVDGTGDRSKIWCCKEQHCVGTWNVRSMNQGKLEVVKQEMARVNINILGISELT